MVKKANRRGAQQEEEEDETGVDATVASSVADSEENKVSSKKTKAKRQPKGKASTAKAQDEEDELPPVPKKLTKAEMRKQKRGDDEAPTTEEPVVEKTRTKAQRRKLEKKGGTNDDDNDDAESTAPPAAKKLTKAQQRKLKNKGKSGDSDDDVDPIAAALAKGATNDDDEDDDESIATAQPVAKKLSKAQQRKLKKKGKSAQDDSDDDDVDPIAAALAKGATNDDDDDDDDDDDESIATAQPVAKKLSRAQQRKLKKKGKSAQDDSDDDIDPIAAALAKGATNDDDDDEDDDDEEDDEPAVAQPVKKLSKAEERKLKKKGKEAPVQHESDDDDDDEDDDEDDDAAIAAADANDDDDEDEEEEEEEVPAAAAPEPASKKAAKVEKPVDSASEKKKLSKAERKKLKKAGDEVEEETKEEPVYQPAAKSLFGKKKTEEVSAFAAAMAKRDQEKKDDDDEDNEGTLTLEEVGERLARYEKKLAKALKKKGDEAEVARCRSKVEKYETKMASLEAAALKKKKKETVDLEKAKLAAGGLLSGKDGEAWRDDANDKIGAIPATFAEYVAQAEESLGKPLTTKAKKKLEKDYNSKKREAAELADREKRSVEGAQFACSQSAIDEKDAGWANALDIKIESFNISAAGKTLFENSPLTIVHGRRYGIVGPNGRGKTTLLKMIANGSLQTPPRVQCLYVEQEVVADDTKAVDAVLRADKERTALLEEEEELSELLEEENLSAKDQKHAMERISAVGEELKAIGAHAAEAKARRILFGLGFSAEMQMRHTKLFSGGWRMRISLARALFMEPTLLMLDEPTNHLDLNAVIWLDDYLQKYKHTLLVVSHDQDFLNSVCDEILHISDDKKLDNYKGNYDTFKQLEKQKRVAQLKAYEKQEKQIRSLKNKSGNSKAKAEELVKKQASNKREPGAKKKGQAIASGRDSAEVSQLIEKPKEYSVTMKFPEVAKLSPPVLQVVDASFRYAPSLPFIFRDMNFGMDQDTRVCVVGNNGSGKSTLLNLLTGKLDATEGTIKRNVRLRIGVYNQHFVERLPMDESPVDYLRRLFQDETYQSIRNMLGRYGLEGHGHTIAMRDLSGGQKARVVLVELSLAAPHMLLLDEPTNNLDIETIDALCDAINTYKGGVICVTHDARLIEATNMRLWVVDNRQVTEWAEPFSAYRDHLLKTLEDAMAQEDQRVTAAGLSQDMGGNRV